MEREEKRLNNDELSKAQFEKVIDTSTSHDNELFKIQDLINILESIRIDEDDEWFCL